MSDIIMKAWSSFIKTGTPKVRKNDLVKDGDLKSASNSKVDNLTWPPMSMENNLYLNIDNIPQMERSEKYDIDMMFWRDLFPC